MSEQDYKARLEMVQRLAPDHPLLSDLQSKGCTRINQIYLQKILAKLEDQMMDQKIDEPDDPKDLQLKNMRMKRRSLYSNRAKLSNSFHKARTNKDRAFISEEIQIIQMQIMELEKKIRYYQQTGQQASGPFDHLPDDTFELFRIKENARKNIPRLEKALEELFALDEKTPGRARKIHRKEKKLAETKRLKAYVEKRIEEKSVRD